MRQLSLFKEMEKELPINPVEAIKNRVLPDWPIVVSYGGGVNSTAMLIIARLKGIKVDAILFADTGNEHPRTYEFIEWFNTWLTNDWQGYPPMVGITVLRKNPGNPGKRTTLESHLKARVENLKSRVNTKIFMAILPWIVVEFHTKIYGVAETLGERCLLSETLPSKAYGYGACSKEWKIAVIEAYIKNNYLLLPITQWIGIHSGETQRLFTKQGEAKSLETSYGLIDYPLVSRFNQNQQNCLDLCRLLEKQPAKSSCWFCPNAKISEVLALKEKHPDFYEIGVFLEKQALQHTPQGSKVIGLGRSFGWSNCNELTKSEQLEIDSIKNLIMCSCTDGTEE
jgi:hypothetical protein